MVVQRGYRQPPSYHIDRLRQAPAGYFFDVITNGFGVMPDYRAQVPVDDRWRIVAYVRALQLPAPGDPTADVPAAELERLDNPDGRRPPPPLPARKRTDGHALDETSFDEAVLMARPTGRDRPLAAAARSCSAASALCSPPSASSRRATPSGSRT